MSGVVEDERRCKELKDHVKELQTTIRNLEDNLKQSNQTDNEVIMSLQSDKIKNQGLTNQLEEALRENQQLLNIIQQKSGDSDLSRANSQGDVTSSCSTMSIVHLQYKYEELLSSHRGLLKLLEVKSDEIKKVYEENARLKIEVEEINENFANSLEKNELLKAKFMRLKERKNEKIAKLKTHRETLQMVHTQLVNVLHNQSLERDNLLLNEIKNCPDSEKALLLEEIRKNNTLTYENFQLTQKIDYLKSLMSAEKRKKNEF